ncbi:hypothetical protein BC826DRAFT_1103612 [Russula brevipes]|nr:hypothetical protein BC826DRAFT_1103612 [Russula brevipes]
MASYWAQPAQLHPWYKTASLKRKLPAMFSRPECQFPLDEDDSDSCAKRQRRLTLDQTRSKRKLPSPPQSPIEDSADPRLFKRQRCTTLERGIERLSLTPPGPQAPEFGARNLLADAWLYISSSQPPPTSIPLTPSPLLSAVADAGATTDVKMRSSSWYEPEKDRIVVTDLDVSSDDEVDVADDAPKLPRSVLQALLRGPERNGPRVAGMPLVPPLQSSRLSVPPPFPDPAGLSESEPRLDEAMDVEF